ncbi:voltage-gated potassium channel, partial [Dendrothele bispora CBS 962.96]
MTSIPLSNLSPKEYPQNPLASYFHFLVEDPPQEDALQNQHHHHQNATDSSDQPIGLATTFPPSSRRRGPSYEASLSWINPPWKRELHLLLEHPTSSTGATLIHILMTFFILLSAVVTVLETVPALRGMGPQVWFGLETTLVALFTVEYVARCIAWSGTWSSLIKWAFCMCSFFAITDLLSVLPYYIEILLHQDTSSFFRFSILRMFRLLRVFRPFRYNHTILLTIEVMYLSVRRSQHALAAIGFFVIMVLSVWSTVLYFIERGTWDPILETYLNSEGDPSQFSSIPAAGWFVLVTITTVGYGELTPVSLLGRLFTIPLLVFGLLLIALPSFVLGREFAVVWEGMMMRSSTRGKVSLFVWCFL